MLSVERRQPHFLVRAQEGVVRELVDVEVLQAGSVVGRPDAPIELEGFVAVSRGGIPGRYPASDRPKSENTGELELHHFLAEAAVFGEHANSDRQVLELALILFSCAIRSAMLSNSMRATFGRCRPFSQ